MQRKTVTQHAVKRAMKSARMLLPGSPRNQKTRKLVKVGCNNNDKRFSNLLIFIGYYCVLPLITQRMHYYITPRTTKDEMSNHHSGCTDLKEGSEYESDLESGVKVQIRLAFRLFTKVCPKCNYDQIILLCLKLFIQSTNKKNRSWFFI